MRRPDPYCNPQGAAKNGQNHRLCEKLKLDVSSRGAYRQPDADFPRTFGHRHQHDIHDADASYDEAHKSDAAEEHRHDLVRAVCQFRHVGKVTDKEIVIFAGWDSVALPEQVDDLLF